MLLEWLTEPPDSSALTMRRCCGALAGILPVSGSAPRRWARPSALRADSRREGVVLAGGTGAVVVVVVVVVPPAGLGVAAAAVGPPARDARNSSMFLTSGSAVDLELARQSRRGRSLSRATTKGDLAGSMAASRSPPR